jgi:hypothetical protein
MCRNSGTAAFTLCSIQNVAISLVEDSDDAAEEYTDGCPIYAACNGDIAAQRIIDAAE